MSTISSFLACLILLSAVFSGLVKAEEPAHLQIIGEPAYYLYVNESNPPRYYYKINVTFYNSGDKASDQVDIKLFEDGKPAVWPDECHGVSFGPREYKNFTFDWATPLTYKIVEIVYGPSNPNKLATKYNSGNKTIKIGYKPAGENKTPGFEFPFIILAIFFIVLYLKRFKNKE